MDRMTLNIVIEIRGWALRCIVGRKDMSLLVALFVWVKLGSQIGGGGVSCRFERGPGRLVSVGFLVTSGM